MSLLSEKKLDEAKVLAKKLQIALDKAAKTKVIHKNRASKNLSSVHKALAKAK